MILSSDVTVRCDACGCEHTVRKEDFDDNSLHVDSSGMGERFEHDFEYETGCPKCGAGHRLRLVGFEYPAGSQEGPIEDECTGCKVLGEPHMVSEYDDHIESLTLRAGREFEEIAFEAIRGGDGFEVVCGAWVKGSAGHAFTFDFVCTSANGQLVYIDLKSYASSVAPDGVILRAARRLSEVSQHPEQGCMLVVSSTVSGWLQEEAAMAGVVLADVWDLLSWVEGEELSERVRRIALLDPSLSQYHAPRFEAFATHLRKPWRWQGRSRRKRA